MNKSVFVTGATGFVGGHVARALLESGYQIKALVRPRNGRDQSLDERLPEDLRGKVEVVGGDLLEAGHLVDDLRGCDCMVHTGALYTFAPAERKASRDTNVRGTASLMEAARLAGVERVVVTSSSATVGPARNGRLATEQDWAVNHGSTSAYHASKIEQERRALAAQITTILVLPTTPVGPGDAKPTPTGRVIVDFMRGRIFAALRGGLNLVPVEDVARAHVLALEKGRPNERYLIGGENVTLMEFFSRLAKITGKRAPTQTIPYQAATVLATVDEIRCRLTPGAAPVIPLEGVRMGREMMHVSSERAATELEFKAGDVDQALMRAVDWYRANGYS